MATLREIKRRIGGVRSTQKITRAMKVVATTRLKKCEKVLFEGVEYRKTLGDIFTELSRSATLVHPLLEPVAGASSDVAVIVLSSDRGLCGSFNSMLFKKTDEFIRKDLASVNIKYVLLGGKAEQYYKRKSQDVLCQVSRLNDEERHQAYDKILQDLIKLFLAGTISKVYLSYNFYESRSRYGVRQFQLLPLSAENFVKEGADTQKQKQGLFLIEPSVEECLKVLIPLFLLTTLKSAFVESQTAEELSRMLAMDYATENANELIETLTLAYNRKRQEVITKEISEIVGGAEALK